MTCSGATHHRHVRSRFIGRRLDGQPLGLIVATRPLDPTLTPDAAMLVADPAAGMLRPSPLTPTAIGEIVAARFSEKPDASFVNACLEATDGNPFLVGERGAAPSGSGLAGGRRTGTRAQRPR